MGSVEDGAHAIERDAHPASPAFADVCAQRKYEILDVIPKDVTGFGLGENGLQSASLLFVHSYKDTKKRYQIKENR